VIGSITKLLITQLPMIKNKRGYMTTKFLLPVSSVIDLRDLPDMLRFCPFGAIASDQCSVASIQ
jgi:hypothetical protein